MRQKFDCKDIQNLYDEIDEDLNIDLQENRIMILENYQNCLPDIELFVMHVLGTSDEAFKESTSTDIGRMTASTLGTYYYQVNGFLTSVSDDKIYSPHVALFLEAFKSLNVDLCFFSEKPSFFDEELQESRTKIFNRLIAEIRKIGSNKSFKQAIYSRDHNIKRGLASYKEYVDSLLENYSRLLVLRLDLFFLAANGKVVSLSEAQGYFARFLNNRRTNSVFDGTVGYIWKFEHGAKRGYHYHLFFFLDGSKAHKDAHRAHLIGKYWSEVTQGNGFFYNVNYNKRQYERTGIGIGMLSHVDVLMRERLFSILEYFFKKEQFLKEKITLGMRTIGRGEISKSRTTKSGRPRRKPEA
jgi:hypothetical protein